MICDLLTLATGQVTVREKHAQEHDPERNTVCITQKAQQKAGTQPTIAFSWVSMAGDKESFAASYAGTIHHTSNIGSALIIRLKINLVNPNKDCFIFLPLHDCQVCIPCLPAYKKHQVRIMTGSLFLSECTQLFPQLGRVLFNTTAQNACSLATVHIGSLHWPRNMQLE